MNVSLTPELEEFVSSKVEAGLYRSNSEVVRQGLRLLIEREQLLEARLGVLKAEVKEGLDQARRGELIPVEEIKTRLQARAGQRTG
jgi:antitoxin ParD1/3/4